LKEPVAGPEGGEKGVDSTLTNVRQLAQAGVWMNGLFSRDEDLSGMAFSFAQPQARASQNEKVIDAFHRFQATRHSQLSLGTQLIIDPGNAPGEDAMGFSTHGSAPRFETYIRLRI
jgi:hypothetical protein